MHNISMSAKKISITLPEGLLKVCEEYCESHYSSLSEMIKNALIAYIPGEDIPLQNKIAPTVSKVIPRTQSFEDIKFRPVPKPK